MIIQLRVRSEFTFGETFAPLDRLITRLKAQGCTAAGLVDSGTWGHVQWAEKCKAAGIAPMFGVALAVVPNLESEERQAMWFLALTDSGLKELYRYSSLAQRQAERGFARLCYADVQSMSAEICKFAGAVLDGPFLKSISAVLDFDPGMPIANRRKLSMGRELGLRTVLISDNAYPAPEDRTTFEMIGRQSKPTPQHLLTTPEAQRACDVTQTWEASLANAAHIAQSAGKVSLPHAPLIKVEGDLEAWARDNIPSRFPDGRWTDVYEARLKRELELIRSKDFESYFLMVADMVRYAKQHMLVGPSRGSAAGSIVCYLTRITEIDPIPSKLIFERFIDVTRKDLPDIDLDFVDSKRHMVLEYLQQKYGAANVAQIGTVSTYQPKSALIAVAKKLNIPPWETNAVKNSIFERSSGDSRANFALLDTLEQTEPGRKLLEKHPAMRYAANIEAHASHSGVHAAGILVCNEAIENFCTVTASGVAQLDKKDAEKLNLLKIDVLGLRTLGVLEDSGLPIDWYGLTFTDPAVFKVINDHRFAGLFQFEGPALQSVCSQMTVDTLEDIGHITALARPGPMASGGTKDYLLRRAGKQTFRLPHPAVEPYVRETFGVVAYQEQTLEICRGLGRMSWEDVTLLRKAMSKSLGKEYFDQFRDKFVKGAAEGGIDEASAIMIWEMVNSMGSWAFNKCLSAGTKVKLSSPGPYKRWFGTGSPTIEQLYRWQQRGIKASLLSSDGKRCAPHRLAEVTKGGKKLCFEYKFKNIFAKRGERIVRVVCTADHKFLINGSWKPIREASMGDSFEAFINIHVGQIAQRLRIEAGEGFRKHGTKGNRPGGKGEAAPGFNKGIWLYVEQFRSANSAEPCHDCGKKRKRMEAHHNDFCEGKKRPKDLAWLCPRCHSLRHRRRVRYDVGLQRVSYQLFSVKRLGMRETYDIAMPGPHNFLLNNGLLTHNSHSYSYAVVSYWTAWLKAHHLLEFAAATLRNCSEDSTIKLLRELTHEGIQYVAFDPAHSESNWAVKNGTLYGGFTGLKGIGTAKAAQMLAMRKEALALPPGTHHSDWEAAKLKLNTCERMFEDVFPTRKRWGTYYTHPEQHPSLRPGTKVVEIKDIEGEGDFVYIGRMRGKDLRDYNEAIRVKRRSGKKYTGPTLFLDLDIEDDTGKILTRIDRYDFEALGRAIWEAAPMNTWWIVRGKRKLFGRQDGGFKMIYVDKIKQLHEPT